MEKLFNQKEKRFYSPLIGFSLTLFSWALYRNETCGYDCGLFTVSSGPTVVVIYILSFWTLVITTGVFLFKFLVRKFGKNKT